ncbi:pyruvate dehydrogenase E1 component [Methylophilaceae bacterium]|nr:pyruvate dehydrogenase E1 component [Methylophilaceae bacterium]
MKNRLGWEVTFASFQSAATLYDVGFNHFFRAANDKFQGDLVYFQGHSSPGVYARAFLEGRISEDQLTNFVWKRW